MKTSTKINILIDNHPKVAYINCPGCEVCDQIRELGMKLNQTPEERYKHILNKGPYMGTEELRILLNNGVQRKLIMQALEVDREQFDEITKNFKPSPNKKKAKALSPEEYIECKKARMTNNDIADQYGIGQQTINQYVRKWLRTGEISQEVYKSIPKIPGGKKTNFAPITKEQFQHAKEMGWTKVRMAKEYKVTVHWVNKSIAQLGAAE